MNDPMALFGWAALLEALDIINEHDPRREIAELDSIALAQYVALRRDALIHYHLPAWEPACEKEVATCA